MMDQYNLQENLHVFGMKVDTFPLGIGEAFETLVKKLEEGYNRSYFGISWFETDGTITYIAAAEEKFEGEALTYQCEKYIIEKGTYLAITVQDWRKKTNCIKDVFHEIMQDSRTNGGLCIEWYKDDDEMFCMIKIIEQSQEAV